MIDTLRRDLIVALRGFRKSPAFTAVALLTLVLGIGANTAIFSVVNGALIRSLPFDRPESLVVLHGNVRRTAVERRNASYPDFLDWRAQSQLTEGMAGYVANEVTLGGAEPERITAEIASASYFPLLGVRPALGRTFRDAEDLRGADAVAVLSHAFWQRRFGGDPAAVGRVITLDARPLTIVGIMPAGFRGLTDRAELWVTWPAFAGNQLTNRGSRGFPVVARLKPGVTIEQAQTEITGICEQLARAYPDTNDKRGAEVVWLTRDLLGEIRPALLAVLGAVAFVLLIACANVASLLLGRAEARQREMALRSALGASRGRLWTQLITEGLLLTVVAGALGLLASRWAADALLRFSPVSFPGFVQAALDPTVLAFTLGVSVVAGLLLGLAPLWHIDVAHLAEALKEDSGRGTAGKGRLVFRQAIIVAEVALALMLLVGAGLFMRSLSALSAIDPGFSTERLLTMSVTLPQPPPPVPAAGTEPDAAAEAGAALTDIVTRLRALPGVAHVGVGSDIPLAGGSRAIFYTAEGQPSMDAASIPRAYVHRVQPGFFDTLGLDLVAGRDFTDADLRAGATAVIVSENVVRRFWPGEPRLALGKRLKGGDPGSKAPWLDIVGIVGETQYRRLPRNPTPDPDLYLPLSPGARSFALFVRARQDAEALTSAVRRELRAAAPAATLFDVSTMEGRVDRQMARSRFVTWLMGLFASVALLLAAIGVYGVMAQAVARRTQEIGIRMALGANPRDVLWLVVGRGLLLIGIGIGAGAGGALLIGPLLRTLLFGVGHADPLTFLLVAALLTLVALAATAVPAWRAMRVDPLVALRR